MGARNGELHEGRTKDGEPLVEIERLTKVFGRDPDHALRMLDTGESREAIFAATGMTLAVSEASFSVARGEIFVVMGLSGSGKSTLLRLVNRLIEPTRGRVRIGGREVTGMGAKDLIALRRHGVSMVFQSFALMAHLKVWENAAFGLDVAGMGHRARRDRAVTALEKVGLGAHADRHPAELSGGMRQRVGLARALATEAPLLLMDEAFSALDPLIRAEMQDQLLELQRREGLTVLFISHDLDEAMRIGSRIAIVHEGRVLQVGTPREILHHPADDHVRSFFGGVDWTHVLRAGDMAEPGRTLVVAGEREAVGALRDRVRRTGRRDAHLVTADGRFVGVVTADSLDAAAHDGASALEAALEAVEPLPPDASFQQSALQVARVAFPLPVVDDAGRYVGAVSKTALLETLIRPGAA